MYLSVTSIPPSRRLPFPTRVLDSWPSRNTGKLNSMISKVGLLRRGINLNFFNEIRYDSFSFFIAYYSIHSPKFCMILKRFSKDIASVSTAARLSCISIRVSRSTITSYSPSTQRHIVYFSLTYLESAGRSQFPVPAGSYSNHFSQLVLIVSNSLSFCLYQSGVQYVLISFTKNHPTSSFMLQCQAVQYLFF
jgi:hypothetical protein